MEALNFYCSLSSRFSNHIVVVSKPRFWKHDSEGIGSTNGRGVVKHGLDTRSTDWKTTGASRMTNSTDSERIIAITWQR